MPISKFEDYKLLVQPSLICSGGSLLNVPLNQFSQSLSSSMVGISNEFGVSGYSDPIPLGFNFNFDEQYYSACKVNVNGFLILGTITTPKSRGPDLSPQSVAKVNNVNVDPQVNNLNQSFDQPIISPWWDALQTTEDWHPAPTNGGVWIYSGSSGLRGNRIFCARWYCNDYSTTAAAKKITFEVILHENTNTIEFNYQPYHNISASAAALAGASIGAAASASNGIRFRSFEGADYYLGGSVTADASSLNAVGNWPAGPLSASSYPQKRYIFLPREKQFKPIY